VHLPINKSKVYFKELAISVEVVCGGCEMRENLEFDSLGG
jgi:hypothetical protein